MTTVREAIAALNTDINVVSDRLSSDAKNIARWLMTYRVHMKPLQLSIAKAVSGDKNLAHSLHIIQQAMENVEEIIDRLDMYCAGDLASALSLVEALDDFCVKQADLNAHPINDPEVRRQVLEMTNGRCTYCDAVLSDSPVEGESLKLFVEHVVPSSKGGPNHLVNYVPSCGSCNSAKGDRHVLHFVRKVQPLRVQASNVVSIVEAAE